MSHRRGKKVWLLLLIVPAVVALAGLAVMLLWNAILPSLLDVRRINFWQASGLFILSKILFGNFRPRGGGHRFGPHAAGHLREKLMNATDEERAALREEWKRRFRH
ncbi:MAG: hypothetical protein H6550_12095 [Chitinophagales bacterium]|nr:hypothetical protein [Chitinophagales bacterium]